jgi:hypothetical protein
VGEAAITVGLKVGKVKLLGLPIDKSFVLPTKEMPREML